MTKELGELFSPEELEEVRKRLEKECKSLLSESGKTIDSLQELVEDEISESGDRAYLESERNLNFRIKDRERKLIKKIGKILERIQAGEYQSCVECGETIAKKRLFARPVTDLCLNCKENQERAERNRNL